MNNFWEWLFENSAAFMVLLTGLTIIISLSIQLRNEYLRKEDIRARINFFIVNDNLYTYLCITNIGEFVAWNIHVEIEDVLIEKLPNINLNKLYLQKLNEKTLCLEPREKIYYLLGTICQIKKLCETSNIDIKISGKYCNRYKINKRISINEFINHPPYKLLKENSKN